MIFILSVLLLGVEGDDTYDGFSVTFGHNALNPYVFSELPRTSDDAESDEWVSLSTPPVYLKYYRGTRYIRYDIEEETFDPSVMPIYDDNGYIAGVQTGIPTTTDGYPTDALIPPLVNDLQLNVYTMTVYFVDPSTIDDGGRSEDEFDEQGTRNTLVLQNGIESDYITIPINESSIDLNIWTEGKCLTGMGRHYFYDLTTDTYCDEIFPIFALYEQGSLSGFGHLFMGDYESMRFEHPTNKTLLTYLPEDDAPDCLHYEQRNYSSIHYYFTDYPMFIVC